MIGLPMVYNTRISRAGCPWRRDHNIGNLGPQAYYHIALMTVQAIIQSRVELIFKGFPKW